MTLPHVSAFTSNTRSNRYEGGVYGFFFDTVRSGALRPWFSWFGCPRFKVHAASAFDVTGSAHYKGLNFRDQRPDESEVPAQGVSKLNLFEFRAHPALRFAHAKRSQIFRADRHSAGTFLARLFKIAHFRWFMGGG